MPTIDILSVSHVRMLYLDQQTLHFSFEWIATGIVIEKY
jgi:hypothetical protein